MDPMLANSQANLAYKQRELAKQAKFQLHPESDLDSIEKSHLREIEELFNTARSLKDDAENQVPVWDPIAQIQQKKIQLLIAERQLKSAEKQIQIIQAHILSIMDPERSSALGRQSDLRNADELKKQAQPLLSEATDLIKKARHSVTFAELGARQRMGSFQKNLGYESEGYEPFSRGAGVPFTVPEDDKTRISSFPPPNSHPQSPHQDNMTSNQMQWSPPPTPATGEGSEHGGARFDQFSIPVKAITPLEDFSKDKPKSECCCCRKGWLIFFIIVILLLAVGAGIYVLTIYDVINF